MVTDFRFEGNLNLPIRSMVESMRRVMVKALNWDYVQAFADEGSASQHEGRDEDARSDDHGTRKIAATL